MIAENQLEIDSLLTGPGTPYMILDLSILNAPPVRSADYVVPGRHGWGFAPFDTYAGLVLNCKMLVLKDDPEVMSPTKNKTHTRANLNELRRALSLFTSNHSKVVSVFMCGESTVTRLVGRVRQVSVDDSTMAKAWATVDWQMVSELPYRSSFGESQVTIPLPVASGGRVYPRIYPLVYGSIGTPGVETVTNVGNAPVFPTFRVNGGANGVTDPSIINVNESRMLRFQNLTIPAGSFLLIDTKDSTVLLDGITSRLDKLVQAEWFVLNPGSTDIHYTANTVLTGSTLDVFWRDGFV